MFYKWFYKNFLINKPSIIIIIIITYTHTLSLSHELQDKASPVFEYRGAPKIHH